MKTATPETMNRAAQGWVLYDGDCSLCTRAAHRFDGLLHRIGFKTAALQTAASVPFDHDEHDRPREMLVVLPDGQTIGGADGIVQIARRIWWAWPLYALAQIPGIMPLLRVVYRFIADRRACATGACQMPKRFYALDWAPLITLPLLTFLTRNAFPAWAFMWLLAWALFFGCKWLTWRRAARLTDNATLARSLGYLFLWIGMDARRFFAAKRTVLKPNACAWLHPTLNVLLGTTLIWFVTRNVFGFAPIVAGWTGMLGVILCLHFGFFQLLALAWQHAGVDAPLLMNHPTRSTSLAEFWGRRWNAGFHHLAHELVFRPLLRKTGPIAAMLMVFLISGLIHDLIISVPAHGGYGLPTAYFLIQGLGLIFERTAVAQRLGLGRGRRGWLFTAVCTAGPAYWLFHPIFVHNIILPMLHAVGAI